MIKKMKPKNYDPSNNSEIRRKQNEGERVVSSYCERPDAAQTDPNNPDTQEVTTDYFDEKGITIFSSVNFQLFTNDTT